MIAYILCIYTKYYFGLMNAHLVSHLIFSLYVKIILCKLKNYMPSAYIIIHLTIFQRYDVTWKIFSRLFNPNPSLFLRRQHCSYLTQCLIQFYLETIWRMNLLAQKTSKQPHQFCNRIISISSAARNCLPGALAFSSDVLKSRLETETFQRSEYYVEFINYSL